MIADKRIIKVMIDAWTDSCPAAVSGEGCGVWCAD